MAEIPESAGSLLKFWRERRRKSQLDLALDAEVTTKHLSFVETGRAKPSREMILLLAENLEIPVRERNNILLSGGYAPVFPEKNLDDVSLKNHKQAIELILKGHEPFPALAIDRHWNMVAANNIVPIMIEGVSKELLVPPVNVLRLSLHPDGLASRVTNFPEWSEKLLLRLKKQVHQTADPGLENLFKELSSYPGTRMKSEKSGTASTEIFAPFRINSKFGPLSFISTTTVFGTPVDVTVSEIALETFFPADDATRKVFKDLAKEIL